MSLPYVLGTSAQGGKKFNSTNFQVKYFYYQNYYISCESSNVTAWCKNSTRVRSYSPHFPRAFQGPSLLPLCCARRCCSLWAGPPWPPPAAWQGRARLPRAAQSTKGEAAPPGLSQVKFTPILYSIQTPNCGVTSSIPTRSQPDSVRKLLFVSIF